MKIGVDAYFLSMKENTGIGYYVINLLNELSKIDKTNKYFLYTPSDSLLPITDSILKNHNFKIIVVKSRLSKTRRLWLQSLSLRTEIINDKVDIFWGGGEYVPILLPNSIMVIATIHDLVFKLFPDTVSLKNRIFYEIVFRLCLKRTDRVITISDNSKKDIMTYLKYKPDAIDVIYNGIDLSSYGPSALSNKSKYILFVGTLQPRKNLATLIKAFSMISIKSDYKLVIVGASGWKSSPVFSLIESLPVEIKKQIEFKGYVSSKELIALYQNAEIFAAPSLHEGFGLIIAEAMACGTPVVTTLNGAIPELFSDIPQYIQDPYSESELAQAITGLIKSDSLRIEMRERGLEFVKKYDLAIMGRSYYRYFCELGNNKENNIPYDSKIKPVNE